MKRIRTTIAAVAAFASLSVGLAGTANADYVATYDTKAKCISAMAVAQAHPLKTVTKPCYSASNGPGYATKWAFRYTKI
jgi:hypothetical protein